MKLFLPLALAVIAFSSAMFCAVSATTTIKNEVSSRHFTNYERTLRGAAKTTSNPATTSKIPTKRPTTKHPTKKPTKAKKSSPPAVARPTTPPTILPTTKPTPSPPPTKRPTKVPTNHPTKVPTKRPTRKPTRRPTKQPTSAPTPKNPLLVRLSEAIGDVQECPNAKSGVFENPDTPRGKAAAHIISAAAAGADLSTDLKLVQRYALAVFYFSTGGDGWQNNENWLSYTDPCDLNSFWSSIGCDVATGQVIGLSHIDNNLVGDLPCEVDLFSSEHPSGAGKLQVLFLSENFRLRTAPNKDVQWLNGLGTALEILHIDITLFNASFPDEMGQRLPNLKEFAASNVLATNQDLSFLSTFSRKLEALWLEYNNIGGTLPTFLGEFQLLGTFYGGHNRFVGTVPTELANIPNKPVFYFDYNNLTGTVDDPNLCSNLGGLVVDCSPSCVEVTCNCAPCACFGQCE